MVLDTKILGMAAQNIVFLWITLPCIAFGTMYTRCNSLYNNVYISEPIFTGTCMTLLDAAAHCLNNQLCDMISKNETRCSFHTSVNRTSCCISDVMTSGTVSKAHFTPCNCILTDIWVAVGPLYLYVTPETYLCSQGPDVCKSLGGIMAEFDSTDEMNYALSYVKDDAFVGGQKIIDKYYWRNNGLEIDGSFWAENQPENQRSCVQLWYDDGGLDDTGSDRLKQILCQKRIL